MRLVSRVLASYRKGTGQNFSNSIFVSAYIYTGSNDLTDKGVKYISRIKANNLTEITLGIICIKYVDNNAMSNMGIKELINANWPNITNISINFNSVINEEGLLLFFKSKKHPNRILTLLALEIKCSKNSFIRQ